MRITWVLLTLAAMPLCGQGVGLDTAELEGMALRAGKAAPGVRLLLRDLRTAQTRLLTSDSQGRYSFRFLTPGSYRLSAQDERGSHAQMDLELTVGARHRVDVPLIEAATVDVEAPGSDQVRAQVASQVSPLDLLRLPILRRSYADLALATPLGVAGRGPVTGGAPDSRLSFLGGSPRQNAFLLDGLDHGDPGNGSLRMPIPQEAIQAFQVLGSGFGAEFGRASGGVLNAVTRGGGNAVSGTAFWYQHAGAWDAQSPLGPTTQDLRLNQVGMSAGGPLVKDKAFWFVAVERLQQRDRNIVTIDPLAASLIQAQGFPVALGGLPAEEQITSGFAKFEAIPSPAQTLAVTLAWSNEKNENQVPWGGLTARSAGGRRETRATALSFTHRWMPSESFVNEFRLHRGTRDNDLTSLEQPEAVSVVIQGSATFGSQMLAPQSTQATYTQITDTLTGVAGNHTWKAGVDLLSSHNRGSLEDTFAGYYLFAALPPLGLNTSLEAFAAPNPFGGQGLPVAFLQKFGNSRTDFRAHSLALFFQDEWRPTPDFSIRLGLRWDRESLPAFKETADYRALAQPPQESDPVWGPIRLPDGDVAYSELLRPSLQWSSQRFSPRLGFSWQVKPEFRLFGGMGRFEGPVNLGPVFGVRIQNGEDSISVIRTVFDPVLQGPWISWASADGMAQGRRYSAPPAGGRMLVIPGEVASPEVEEVHFGMTWKPDSTLECGLEALRSRGKNLMNLRDVNAYVPFGPAARRPDLRYASVFRADSSGQSRAWFLTGNLLWRPRPSLHLEASYSRGSVEDNYVDWTGAVAPQNTFDPEQEWGPSYQNQRHRFFVKAHWQQGFWGLSAMGRIGSGRPTNLLVGYDRNMDGDAGSDRPEGVGRNSLETPWTRTLDLRLTRSLLRGDFKLDAVLDVINAFNRANALEFQNSLGSLTPPFGTPVAYGPMRQFQVGLRGSW